MDWEGLENSVQPGQRSLCSIDRISQVGCAFSVPSRKSFGHWKFLQMSKPAMPDEYNVYLVHNNMLQIVLTGLLLLHVEVIVKFVHEAGK